MSEKWPLYDPGPNDHIHALGVVSANYNNLEWVLLLMHLYWSGAPHPFTSQAFKRSSNDVRLSLLKILARTQIKDEAVRASILHFAAGFQLCSKNRNTLLHSQILNDFTKGGVISAVAVTRSGAPISYDFSLTDIRRVADELFVWYMFGNRTMAYEVAVMGVEHRGSLPEKPALPDLLEAKSPPNRLGT